MFVKIAKNSMVFEILTNTSIHFKKKVNFISHFIVSSMKRRRHRAHVKGNFLSWQGSNRDMCSFPLIIKLNLWFKVKFMCYCIYLFWSKNLGLNSCAIVSTSYKCTKQENLKIGIVIYLKTWNVYYIPTSWISLKGSKEALCI